MLAVAEEKISKNKENLRKVTLSSKEETPKHWGRWTLDEENLSLFTNYDNDEKRYSLPLVLFNNPEETLGWIISIQEKLWTTNQDIGDLIEALNDLLNLKSHFGGKGSEQDNGNIGYIRNVVEQRIRLNKMKIINKEG